MPETLCLDIGATYIKSGIVNEKGKVKNGDKIENRSANGESFFVKQIIDLINKYKEKNDIKKVGIGFAGQVDYKKGIIISDTNMGGIKNLYLKATLERKIHGISVMIDGDAHCFSLAESKFGAGKKYNDMIGITLGTGIGGGIIINKKLYRGANNTAGELGHIIIDANSESVCGCGGYGHLEALASGRALQNLYKEITEQDADIDLIIDMAVKGEKIAQKAIIQIGFNFSLGLANIINSLDPEIVVIGGGLINIEFLWKVILNNLPNYLMREYLEKTKIVKSKLGDNGGVIGASLL